MGALAVYVWVNTRQGPAVTLTLKKPGPRAVLAPDEEIVVEGAARKSVGPVVCDGVSAEVGDRGSFELRLPGPEKAGLHTIYCRAENELGKTFHFRFGRLAGRKVPLDEPVTAAVRAVLPQNLLRGSGGLLAELDRLVDGPLRREVNEAGKSLGFRIGRVRAGGVTVGRLGLKAIRSSSSGELVLSLAVEDICVHFGVRSFPGWLGRLASRLPRKGSVCLPISFDLDLAVLMRPGRRPQLRVGALSTRHVEKVASLEGVAEAEELASALATPVRETLQWVAERAEGVLEKLDEAVSGMEKRLGELSDLLPAAPKSISAEKIRICFDFSVHRLGAFGRKDDLLAEMTARPTGYTVGGAPCRAESIESFPEDAYRIAVASGDSKAAKEGAAAEPGGGEGARLGISMDLINAYVTALWWAGAFRDLQVSLSQMKSHGFDVRKVSLLLPPLITSGGERVLNLCVAEMETLLATTGEPRRFLRVSGVIPLSLELSSDGALGMSVGEGRWPKIDLRCVGELSGAPCASQSRRYQQLVETAMELARAGKIDLPDLALSEALPAWSSERLEARPKRVAGGDGSVWVTLELRSRRLTGGKGSGTIGRP
jgi:hypothetical protein